MIRKWEGFAYDDVSCRSTNLPTQRTPNNVWKLSKKRMFYAVLIVILFVAVKIYNTLTPAQIQTALASQAKEIILTPIHALNKAPIRSFKSINPLKTSPLFQAHGDEEIQWFEISFSVSTLDFNFQGADALPVLYLRTTAFLKLSNGDYIFRRYYLSDGIDFHDGFISKSGFLENEKLLLEFIGFDEHNNDLNYRIVFGFHRFLGISESSLKLKVDIMVDYLSLRLGMMDANECKTQRFLGKLTHTFEDILPFRISHLKIRNTWQGLPDGIVLDTFRNWFIHDGALGMLGRGPSLASHFEYNYNGQPDLKCSAKEFSFSSKQPSASSFDMLFIGDSQPHRECTQLQGSLGGNGGSIKNRHGKTINMAVKCAPMRAGGITANTFWVGWLKDQLDGFLIPKSRSNEIDKMLVLNFAGLWEAQRGKINIDNGTSFELRLASMINIVIDAVEVYEKNSNAHVEIYYMTTTMIQPHNHFSIISMETDYHPMSELRNIWFNQLVRKIFHQNARINSKVMLVDAWRPSRTNEDDMSFIGDPLHYNGKGSRRVVNFLLCNIFKGK